MVRVQVALVAGEGAAQVGQDIGGRGKRLTSRKESANDLRLPAALLACPAITREALEPQAFMPGIVAALSGGTALLIRLLAMGRAGAGLDQCRTANVATRTLR